MKTTKKPIQITPHAAKAAQFGVHQNILYACQRREALPADVDNFDLTENLFLEKLAKIVGNQRLIQLQLRLFSADRTKILLEEPEGNEKYKAWERRAIELFGWQYKALPAEGMEKPTIDTEKVMNQVQMTHNVMDTKKNRARLKELRKIAYDRNIAPDK